VFVSTPLLYYINSGPTQHLTYTTNVAPALRHAADMAQLTRHDTQHPISSCFKQEEVPLVAAWLAGPTTASNCSAT
jgi:hypothetical protein